jgi:hypothetical protein
MCAAIERHWRQHRSRMVRPSRRRGLPDQAIENAAERTAAGTSSPDSTRAQPHRRSNMRRGLAFQTVRGRRAGVVELQLGRGSATMRREAE